MCNSVPFSNSHSHIRSRYDFRICMKKYVNTNRTSKNNLDVCINFKSLMFQWLWHMIVHILQLKQDISWSTVNMWFNLLKVVTLRKFVLSITAKTWSWSLFSIFYNSITMFFNDSLKILSFASCTTRVIFDLSKNIHNTFWLNSNYSLNHSIKWYSPGIVILLLLVSTAQDIIVNAFWMGQGFPYRFSDGGDRSPPVGGGITRELWRF